MSGAFDRPIPAIIPPITESKEKVIISNIFTELNEKFCVDLDDPPSFSRSISALPTVHGSRRTVVIGGSNLGKIAKAAVESGSAVVYLTASGWSPKPGNIKKITEVLKNLQLKPCVTIVIDAMANSTYLGTDDNGLPLPSVKSAEDGRHHLIGDLQLAPPPPLKTNLKQVEILIEHSGWARIVILVPVLRYVRGPCCGDGGHVTNSSEEDLFNEILIAEKRLTDAAAPGLRTREAKVIDLCKLFGLAETPIQDLTTTDGTSIWAEDVVHLMSPAFKGVARFLMAELERADHGEVGKPAVKRARLESVVPASAPAGSLGGVIRRV
jgi:hypothetical protein